MDPAAFVARCLHASHPRDVLRNGLEWLCHKHRTELAAATYSPGGDQPLARETWQQPDANLRSMQPVLEALLEQNQDLAQASGSVLDDSDPSRHLVELSAPLFDDEGLPCGVVVLLGQTDARCDHALRLAHLTSDVALLNVGLTSRKTTGNDDRVAIDSMLQLSHASKYGSLAEFAFQLAHSLRIRTGCNEVAIGRVVRNRVRLLTVTGADAVQPRASNSVALTQAMEECFDLNETLVAQPPTAGVSPKAPRLHETLRASLDDGCVVSVPIQARSAQLVVTCSRIAEKPFSTSEVERLEEALQQLAPSFDLVERGTRGLTRHLFSDVRAFCTRSSRPRRWLKCAIATALLTFATWFAFGTLDHEIAVQCRVLPERILHITAPFDGTILDSNVRPNTLVHKGTVLCRFDTTALQLQHAELTAQLQTHALEVQQHIAAGDTPAAQIAEARRKAVESRIAAIDHQTKSSVLVAGEDVYVLRGDLSQRVGQVVPQGEPLFELVPAAHDSVRVSVEVPEDYALEVTQDQPLRFVCNARPDQPIEAHIDRVALSATALDGQNAFVAEAHVDDPTGTAWVRPGMEGTARLNLGTRPVRFVAFHRLTNWLRRNFWL